MEGQFRSVPGIFSVKAPMLLRANIAAVPSLFTTVTFSASLCVLVLHYKEMLVCAFCAVLHVIKL